MLTADAQIRHGCLNTAFWPTIRHFMTPPWKWRAFRGVSGACLSADGQGAASEAIRLVHTGPRPYRLAAHLWNAVLGAPRGAKDILDIICKRFITKRGSRAFWSAIGAASMRCTTMRNRFPTATAASRLARKWIRSACRVPSSICVYGAGCAERDRLSRGCWMRRCGRMALGGWSTGIRQSSCVSGSTRRRRMASTRWERRGWQRPAQSVVDAELKVHGVENLYVASSSVVSDDGAGELDAARGGLCSAPGRAARRA